MIRFSSKSIEKEISWSENNHINELVIENRTLLRKIIKSFNSNDEDSEAKFFYSEDSKVLSDSEIDVLYNPFKLEFNSRQTMTALLKILATTSNSEDYYLSTNKIKTKIIQYINELVDSENFGFEVTTDEFTLDQIAKAINLHIVDDEDDYVELLTDYMEAMSELTKIKIFVLVNFQSYIDQTELKRFAQNINNHQFNIFFIENCVHSEEKMFSRLIIDKDLCEI